MLRRQEVWDFETPGLKYTALLHDGGGGGVLKKCSNFIDVICEWTHRAQLDNNHYLLLYRFLDKCLHNL